MKHRFEILQTFVVDKVWICEIESDKTLEEAKDDWINSDMEIPPDAILDRENWSLESEHILD